MPAPDNPLVDARAFVPDAVLDIRYATARSLAGAPLYPFAAAFLRRSAAERLARAAAVLRAAGLRLRVYDAYRPLSVQRRLWELSPDRRFVADPAAGSAHNRGGAVDVGLASAGGGPVAMPSDYDAFGPQGSHDAANASPEARRNLATLKAAMKGAGFVPLPEEWWHYTDPDASAWPVLDVPFDRL